MGSQFATLLYFIQTHTSFGRPVFAIGENQESARLADGSGSVHRSVLGALLTGIINKGLSILNVSIELQWAAKGIIIVLALVLDRYLQFEK